MRRVPEGVAVFDSAHGGGAVMTLDDAVATLLFLADHPVDGVSHTADDGYVTADVFIDDEARVDELMAALHAASEAMSVVCAVIHDRRLLVEQLKEANSNNKAGL